MKPLGVYIGKKLLERYFTKEIIIERFEKIFCALTGMERFIAIQNGKINLIATYLQWNQSQCYEILRLYLLLVTKYYCTIFISI